MTPSEKNFADELKVEGIAYKGYGIIPKAVTLNPNLTIEAKAIYAYFASFSGGGNTAFPSRCKILADLKISKDRYYKHLHLLLSAGLITIQEKKDSKFTKNIYTIKSVPADVNSSAGHVVMGGINCSGYGIIPKAVTTDPRLPIAAKGLYAYYASFTGSGRECTPLRNDALFHLSVSSERYSKYRDILERLGYICVSQLHHGGKLSKVQITLLENPDVSLEPQRKVTVIPGVNLQPSVNKDTSIPQQPENKDILIVQPPENKDMLLVQSLGNESPENEGTENEGTENKDTNNNSITNNNFNNNSLNITKREAQSSKTADTSNASRHPLVTVKRPVGIITLPKEEYQVLLSKFQNVNGLFDLSICALKQRNNPPKSIFHFVYELALIRNWPVNDDESEVQEANSLSAAEQMAFEWEREGDILHKNSVIMFMKENGFVNYAEAEDAYSQKVQAEIRAKWGRGTH